MRSSPRGMLSARLLHTLAAGTPWVEPEVRGLRHLVGRGDTVIDVGAGLGVYTSVLARLVGPTGVVLSVEPLPGYYARYDGWLRLRAGANVHRCAVAVADHPHTARVRVPLRRGRPVTGRSFVATGARGLGSNAEFAAHVEHEVPVSTLDDLAARTRLDRVDFVKADVEGAELALARGAEGIIRTFRPSVLLEVENRHAQRYGHCAKDVIGWFAERGYHVSAWSRGEWRRVSNVRDGCRNYLFQPRRQLPRSRC